MRTISNSTFLGLILLSFAAGQTCEVMAQDSPPLVQPGAPGQPSKVLTAKESLALGESNFTDADVSFMQNMIIHHQQAVDMVALIKARTEHPGVRLIGERISTSQETEIGMMKLWLQRRGKSIEPTGGAHGHHMMHGESNMNSGQMDHSKMDHGDMKHGSMSKDPVDPDDIPVMGGMLSANQMRKLASLRDDDFDRMFLAGMIVHHQGALDMVDGLVRAPGAAEDPQMSEFVSAIIADQTTEIQRMRAMLNASYAKDKPAVAPCDG